MLYVQEYCQCISCSSKISFFIDFVSCLIYLNYQWIMIRLKYVNIFFQLIFFSKKELQHFEHRLQKHDHYQDQLRVSEEAVRINYKDGEKPEKHTQLEQTVRDYSRKVQSKSYQNLYIHFFEDIVLLVITMCSMLQFAVLKRWGQMWLL